jgi:hypothetical protein
MVGFKLDPEFKARWLKALRSGRYRQGRGFLKRRTEEGLEYCCLGVGCNVWDGGRGWRKRGNEYGFYHNVSESIMDLPFLPRDVIVPPSIRATSQLATLNDAGHQNFHQIADWIEENL